MLTRKIRAFALVAVLVAASLIASDTTLNRFVARGTTAQRGAFTPSAPTPASGPSPGYVWFDTTLNKLYCYDFGGSAWVVCAGSAGSGTVTNTGTLANNALVKGNGGVDVSTITTGTGILTALGINTGSAGAPVLFNGALGTPSSGTLTNTSGLPGATGITGQTTVANLPSNYLLYQDQEAQNTEGGTLTSGAWRTRVLNTEVSDVGGFGTLASNQITLTAGTYKVVASAPAFAVNRNQLRLQNVTDATTLVTGMANYAGASTVAEGAPAILYGVFTVGASKALELQHQGETTRATNGMGVAVNFTTEIYGTVVLEKIP